MATDYRSTVFLPETGFAMRADLPKREPAWLEAWAAEGLAAAIRADSAGRPRWILHDGPPYANGHLHMGTALNKILKDVIVRARQMQGFDAPYVPGWDCHGLPIEWQVEQAYRKRGAAKDAVPIVEFRAECRVFARQWLDVQRAEFQRLGVNGDWANPYATMDVAAEAGIYRELLKFLDAGLLYRGLRPVLWSPVEQTALAEAEVEYKDHTSTTIWVRFPVVETREPALAGTTVVIWTTTPWTMPGNRAVAHGSFDYSVLRVDGVNAGSLAVLGEQLVVADDRLPDLAAAAGITGYAIVATLPGGALAGTMLRHPLAGHGGYPALVPLLQGGFVTTEQGTGLVHIAPSAGEDDFELGQRHGLEVPAFVGPDGAYTDRAPGFAGVHVYKAAEPVIQALTAGGALLARGTLAHSYPHSWRSKAPLIFRATAQWFIAMDGASELRAKALAAIDATRFVPERGRNRLRSMVEDRPDWCVSRQRAWGVPIALFVHRCTGEVLRDRAVLERIAAAFAAEGADAWWARDPQEFLGDAYAAADYEKVDDILDVWFESGTTHAIVLRQRPELAWPADLYLEGSDQHRGWFQSSLLEGCGTDGVAPYRAVLTHGFVVDANGRKMSKSVGNTTLPSELLPVHGADVLRLWAVSADFTEDLRIGKEILDGVADAYRRLRNTLRYLLGNLAGFSDAERLPAAEMPELERWVLHRLGELGRTVLEAQEAYDYPRLSKALQEFCMADLSAFYFDVRKDALYCDEPASVRRRAARTVLDLVFERLVRWLAPILVFTAEEAWRSRHGAAATSVHRQLLPPVEAAWADPALAQRFERLRAIRRVVTGALEVERREKRIGASVQAAPTVWVREDDLPALAGVDLAELAITSGLHLETGAAPPGAFTLPDVPDVAVQAALAPGTRCERCWQVLPEVPAEPPLCHRCAAAVLAQPVHR